MPTRWIRPSISTLGKHFLRRSFYSKTAEFVTRDPQGRPCQRQVDIRVGDEHEAYVLVPTDVGDAIKAACKHNGSSFPQDKQSLEFNHDRRDFTCESAPYLRLSIYHQLPRRSDAKTSSATLYLFGVTHTIALDGTFDAWFTEQSLASWHELKPTLDKLKDM
ncbi:hypothetical protein BU26DRAFT_524963 [Trematosphaeria pertusa]|uniref:Uncharacterized protein n=1 Tax=Trematosphaeria pertusa TaxID=390896 RepID=A0A6A6HW83_9PLEO|nr:uncharacterized protein BU26DRAFT_524963 [Trematosphaeria pertusa]KAF2241823.1 hypothetical protein BU26DRAFT_524963 [Trematosphaeria pertusa]